ncbi:hypothetical protein TRAPUB_10985 [Trametes pubescens]|uniref:Uncharacterized protein n=1 Tax=Trametes pubescens TaxID=154538 RepID=A0A1M2VY56_TRAPU|nr:hypothetical protein TRAPUB_10985 [Trametes pubescens]
MGSSSGIPQGHISAPSSPVEVSEAGNTTLSASTVHPASLIFHRVQYAPSSSPATTFLAPGTAGRTPELLQQHDQALRYIAILEAQIQSQAAPIATLPTAFKAPSTSYSINSSADPHSFGQPSINGAIIPPPPPLPKNRKDYPKVPFWYRHEWKRANKSVQKPGVAVQRGPTRAAQGINVSMHYVSDQEGTIADGFEASAMRKTFREFCVYLWGEKCAPKTWSRDYCDSNWWAEEIALENYSQWRKKHIQYLANREKCKAAKRDAKKKQRKNKSKKNRKGKENHDGTEESSNEDSQPSDNEDDDSLDAQGAKLVGDFFNQPMYTISREASEVPSSTHQKCAANNPLDPGFARAGLSCKKPRLSVKTQASIAGAPIPNESQLPTSASTQCGPSLSPATPSLPSPPSPLSLPSPPSLLSLPSPPSLLSPPSPTNASNEELCVPDPFAGMWGGSKIPAVEEGMSSETASSATVTGDVPAPAMTTAATTTTGPAVPLAVISTTTGVAAAAVAPPVKSEPRRKGKQVAVWPPVPRDDVKLKPKEACAVMWAKRNPAGTKEDFNKWYVKRSQAVCKAYTKDGIDRAMD